MTGEHYVYSTTDGSVSIESAGEILTLDCRGRSTVTVSIEASVASDFALDVDFGDGNWVTDYDTYPSTDTVSQTYDLAVDQVRLRNTTAQTSGDTATPKLGASR